MERNGRWPEKEVSVKQQCYKELGEIDVEHWK